MQVGYVALGQGDDLHAGKGHALKKAGDILLVPAEAVHGLGKHDRKPAARRVLDQLLNARAQKRSAGDGAVDIAVDNRPALLLGMETAQPQLILNRRVALIFRGVAGVERDFDHSGQTTLFGGAVLLLWQCVEILIRSLTGEKPHQLDQPRIAPIAEGDNQPIRQFRFPSRQWHDFAGSDHDNSFSVRSAARTGPQSLS